MSRVRCLGFVQEISDLLSLETSFRPAGCRIRAAKFWALHIYRRRSLDSGPRRSHGQDLLRPVLLSLAFRRVGKTKDLIQSRANYLRSLAEGEPKHVNGLR